MTSRSRSRRQRIRAGAFLILSLCALNFAGCKSRTSRETPADKPAGTEVSEPVDTLGIPPLPMTTRAELVVKTLTARLNHQVNQRDRASSDNAFFRHASAVIDLRLERAHLLGLVSDYAAAEKELAELLAKQEPPAAQTLLLAARVETAIHQFAKAKVSIAMLEALGTSNRDLLAYRGAIWLATGKPQTLIETYLKLRLQHASHGLLLLYAVALADVGQFEAAEEAFRNSLGGKLDGSPQPIVKTLFHWGRMWERQGQPGRARPLYQRAFAILPQYVPLALHLAGLESAAGQHNRAIEILEPLSAVADDPGIDAQLSIDFAKLDRQQDSIAALGRAQAGYVKLLATQPLAFADHAARFFLDIGTDNADSRALELSSQNLENRATDESFQLFFDAAIANKLSDPPTCAKARTAAERKQASSYLLFTAARILESCGEKAAAETARTASENAVRAR